MCIQNKNKLCKTIFGVSCCPTWTRWARPPFDCKPEPSGWHQLTADSSSWPWGWHNTHALLDIWHRSCQTEEFVRQKTGSSREGKMAGNTGSCPAVTVPITDQTRRRYTWYDHWQVNLTATLVITSAGCKVGISGLILCHCYRMEISLAELSSHCGIQGFKSINPLQVNY